MNLFMYAIFDVKADAYNTPFFMPSKGMAIRAFKDLANDKNSMMGMHPEDYKLVELAVFDVKSGEIEPAGATSLGFAFDYVEKPSSKLREVS